MNRDLASYEARVRMPDFYLTESEAKAIQAFLGYLAGIEPIDTGKGKRPSEESIAFGKKIYQQGGCDGCHSFSDLQAGYFIPGGRAPNLQQAQHRLRRDWLRNWLRNPQAIQPGTSMPAFFEYDTSKGRWVIKTQAVLSSTTKEGSWKGGFGTEADVNSFSGDHREALIDFLIWGTPEDYAVQSGE